MNRENVKAAIRKILEDACNFDEGHFAEFQDNADLIEEGGLDSLDSMDVYLGLTNHFRLSVEWEENLPENLANPAIISIDYLADIVLYPLK